MMLNADQQQTLKRALLDHFDKGTLEIFLKDKLGRRLEELSTGPDLAVDVHRVVGKAQQEGWLWDLVRAAKEARPNVEALQALYAALEPIAQIEGIDHYEVCLLQGNEALIDRKELRRRVKELADTTSARVLLVTGPKESGKTHSAQFINHLEKELQTFQVVRVDLVRQARTSLAVVDVAQHIVSQMGLDVSRMPPKGNEMDPRWAQHFWSWMTGELRKTPGTRWYFVIDGFNGIEVPQATRELIEELALRIQQQLSVHSLILLGYEEQENLEVLGVSTEREDIKLIEPQDVVEFFIRVFELRKKTRNQDYTPSDVAKAVEKVLSATDKTKPRWLRQLGSTAAREAKEILRGGGPVS